MKAGNQGRGIGRALIEELIPITEAAGYWTVQAQIIAENHASRALHLRCGFREVGRREKLGHVGGRWHDVILHERRSERAGGPGLPTVSCEE